MRNVIAVIVGLVVGMAVNMGLIMLNTFVLHPAPEGMDMMDPEQMNAYVATLPTSAFIVVLAAHLGQAFIGGWVAAKLGTKAITLALIVGVISLIGGIANMMSITEGPSWMIVELPLYLVVSWIAGRMVAKGRRD